jgi:hypothetical protein
MADARLVLRDGRVVENTLRAADRDPVSLAHAEPVPPR